jgi:hypothetical protein
VFAQRKEIQRASMKHDHRDDTRNHSSILVRILLYLCDSFWLDEKQPLPVSHFDTTMNTGIPDLGRLWALTTID